MIPNERFISCEASKWMEVAKQTKGKVFFDEWLYAYTILIGKR